MENNIDRLFQEGLGEERIEDLGLYSAEKAQWKTVKSQLHIGQKRWFLSRFLPLLFVAGLSGMVFYFGYSGEAEDKPMASLEVKSAGNVQVVDLEIDKTETEATSEEKVKVVEKESNIVEGSQEDFGKVIMQLPKKESHVEQVYGNSISVEKGVMAAVEPEVAKGKSSYQSEQGLDSSQEIDAEIVVSEYNSQYSQTSARGSGVTRKSAYGSEKKNTGIYGQEENTYASSYGKEESNPLTNMITSEQQIREIMNVSELAGLPTAFLIKEVRYRGQQIKPEEFYIPKGLHKRFGFRFGADIPIHFDHERLRRSGFGYDLGTDFELGGPWGISLDYIYQDIDRELTDEFNKYALPFKSDLYQDLKPVSSNYQYNRHTFVIGLKYTIYNRGRLNLGVIPSYELSSRGKVNAEFTYEGPYQQEKENFEFESKLISLNHLSAGIIADYRLFANVHIVGRYRRLIPIGNGEDWNLFDRVFVGLSYKI